MDAHLEKAEKNSFFYSGGLHSWVLGCLVRMGKLQMFVNWFVVVKKKALFSKFYGAKVKIHFVFPQKQQSCENVQLHPFLGQAVNFAKLCFWGACWVGVFFGGGNSLGSKPSLFLLLCYCFVIVSLVWFLFIFCENTIQCLPFFLLSLPFSLSLCLSLSLSLLFICLSLSLLFIFFLPSLCSVFFSCLFLFLSCFGVCLAWVYFFACVS